MKAGSIPVANTILPGSGAVVSAPQSPLLLVPGRMYMISVLQRDGRQALVSVGGKRFNAELIGQPPSGNRVPVIVKEASAQRILLQTVEPQSGNSAVLQHYLDLSGVLQRIGLPVKPEYLICLPHLLQAGTSVSPEAVVDLYEAWTQLTDADPTALPSLANLQAQGIPLTEESLAAARAWSLSETPITNEDIANLSQSLENLAASLANQDDDTLLSLVTALRNLSNTVSQLPYQQNANERASEQLRQLLQTLGTPTEAQLDKLSRLPQSAREATGEQMPANAKFADNIEQLLSRDPQVQLRRLSQALDELARYGNDLSDDSRSALNLARAGLQKITDGLDAQQIANLRTPPDSTVPHYYAFAIPLSWSGPQDNANLRVYYRPGKQKKVDPENTHLALSLNIESLGLVEIDLHIFRKVLSCDVRTGNADINQLAVTRAPDLQSALKRLGYQVQAVRCSTRPTEEAQRISENKKQTRKTSGILQVDLIG